MSQPTQLPKVTVSQYRQEPEVSSSSSPSLSTLSDTQLLTLCTQYGLNAKFWRQKFIGLLPEVEQRHLYLKEGFTSIFEFAAKLGGVSREQVQRVLQLHQRFESTPQLRHALISGQVSVHKLARIASTATPENQEFLLHQSQLLSKSALEVLVKDMKSVSKTVRGHSANLNKTHKIPQFDELKLSSNIRERLLALQNKGINLENLLEEFLNQREERIQQQKQLIARKQTENTASRYIPR